MKKTTSTAFGKKVYLLGADDDGVYYWLKEACWDCGWYWGGGYVSTYTNNKNPQKAKDINSHRHFNGLFFNGNKNGFNAFKDFFNETPFSDGEIWQICKLLKSFYVAREYSDFLHREGAHYTTNKASATIKNDAEYNRINKSVIPSIMYKLYKILEG